MLYRIYTEDVNRAAIEQIAAANLPDGFTLLNGRGCWQGSCENSLVIEAIGIDQSRADAVAAAIKSANNQQAVLIVSIPAESELI